MPITFTRQATSRDMLDIKWDFPKSLELPEQTGHTVVKARMTALPRDEALAELTKGDGRPLLVMRECNRCKGSDVALLSRKLNNEKTLLMAQWFHCVKLRPNVVEAHHTFHNLFGADEPPHLFLATADGSMFVPLDGMQSQALLWKDMNRVLRASYKQDPEQAVKKLFQLMAKYDHFDSMASMYQEQIEVEIEKRGPTSSKLRRLRAKLEKIQQDKAKTKALEAETRDLELIAPKKT